MDSPIDRPSGNSRKARYVHLLTGSTYPLLIVMKALREAPADLAVHLGAAPAASWSKPPRSWNTYNSRKTLPADTSRSLVWLLALVSSLRDLVTTLAISAPILLGWLSRWD
jgi:hypothetical protein